MTERWLTLCERLLLARPWHSLLVMLALLLIVGAHIPDLRFEARPDTLLAEDPARGFAGEIAAEFGPQDFLLVTYRPQRDDLMAERVLERIARLRAELAAVAGVQGVSSILEMPLLFSPPIRFADIGGELQRLQDTGVDTDLARTEFRQSPLYRQSLLSGDGHETALRVTLEPAAADALLQGQQRLLDDLQVVLERHRDEATLFLGGPALTAAAMPAFVQRDLVRYAAATLAVMTLMLVALLRRLSWALVPPVAAALCGVLLLGLLGWSGRPLTAVSGLRPSRRAGRGRGHGAARGLGLSRATAAGGRARAARTRRRDPARHAGAAARRGGRGGHRHGRARRERARGGRRTRRDGRVRDRAGDAGRVRAGAGAAADRGRGRRQPVAPSRAGLLLAGLAGRYGIGATLLALALLAGGLAGCRSCSPRTGCSSALADRPGCIEAC
ncbi:MAG: MMPL family transporter [Gammaproteobacteria bacterium]|nr:MMPL family transporter [Gammaproteobacteria bacterium]